MLANCCGAVWSDRMIRRSWASWAPWAADFCSQRDRLPAIVRESVADQVAYADDQFGFVETLPGAGQIQLGCFSFVAWQAAFALFIHASQGVFGGAVSLGGG